MKLLFGFLIFVVCFQSFLAVAQESDAEAIEASLNSAGRDYLYLFVSDSKKILDRLQSDPFFRSQYEQQDLFFLHDRIEERKELDRRFQNARKFEKEKGLGNDISNKFILVMRKTALEILQTQYLSAGEGSHLIFDVFNLLEKLSDKELPRNYFLLEAADAIRNNDSSLMDPISKDLVLSVLFGIISVSGDKSLSLRHLFGILDFLDSELRIASGASLEFLARYLVGSYLKGSYDFIGVGKTPDPNSPYLKFGIDRIRIYLFRLVKELLPKIANEKARTKLERDLAALRVKFSEAERMLSAQQRAKSKITAGCRKRLSLFGSAD